jgi:molecular chaperone GrpE
MKRSVTVSGEDNAVPSDDDPAVPADRTNDASVEDAFSEFLADDASEASELDKLKAQVAEANDRALRSQAEIENVRRRFRRENEEAIMYANKPLLSDLLPVVDNIERAIESANSNTDVSGLLEGVKIVAEQLLNVLEKHNCPRIAAEGEQFDPELHQAILQQPSDQPKGTVITVAQQGYKLHDRLIRPTQVIVSTGPADE